MSISSLSANGTKWYTGVGRQQWFALIASNMGWMFDGYETYTLILTVGLTLKQLLPVGEIHSIHFFAGLTIATTLLGWGLGGIIGGVLADYIGRRRAMLFSILSYAITTGFSALAWSWWSFIILRFVVGLCIGSEWGTGTSLVAEVFPDKSRAKAAGIMQSGLGIGFFIASLIWFFVSGSGASSWRIMYLIGIIPALALLWIRRNVKESERWESARDLRKEINIKKSNGEHLTETEKQYVTFTLKELFINKQIRKITILGLLMSLTTTVGWWGISTWVPGYVSTLAIHDHLSASHWASLSGMIYNIGAIAGYVILGFLSDLWGRKITTITYFTLSLVLTPILFLLVHNLAVVLVIVVINGLFTLGQYSWMPVWLPEAYPTHIRGTGVSFVFNAARFIAFLGPLFAGYLINLFGGYSIAATIVGTIYILGLVCAIFFPETKGKKLADV